MNKAKKIIGLSVLSLLFGVAIMTATAPAFSVARAEENQETEVVEENEEKKSWEETLKDFKDSYLVPILGSVSITSVVSLCVSIVCSVFNRKTNKLIKLSNADTISLCTNVVKSATALITEVHQGNAITDATKNMFLEQTNNLIERMELLAKKSEKVAEIKDVIACLVEVQNEIYKLDPKAITSGVSEKIAKLNDTVKQIA